MSTLADEPKYILAYKREGSLMEFPYRIYEQAIITEEFHGEERQNVMQRQHSMYSNLDDALRVMTELTNLKPILLAVSQETIG